MTVKRKKTKKFKPAEKFSMFQIMRVVMPCTLLAVKDTFEPTPDQYKEVAARIKRYIGFVADGALTMDEFEEILNNNDIHVVEEVEG